MILRYKCTRFHLVQNFPCTFFFTLCLLFCGFGKSCSVCLCTLECYYDQWESENCVSGVHYSVKWAPFGSFMHCKFFWWGRVDLELEELIDLFFPPCVELQKISFLGHYYCKNNDLVVIKNILIQ